MANKKIKFGQLEGWQEIAVGEVLTFPSASGARKLRLAVSTNCRIDVYAGGFEVTPKEEYVADDGVLVASSDGLFDLEVTGKGDIWVKFVGPEDGTIFVREYAQAQLIRHDADKPAFTNIEPRVRRNTDFDRMMYQMKANEARRERQHQEALRVMNEQKQAFLAAKTPAQSEPEPEPEVIEPEGGADAVPE